MARQKREAQMHETKRDKYGQQRKKTRLGTSRRCRKVPRKIIR